MQDKIADLLKVLDMSEGMQRDWCIENKLLNMLPYTECARYESLADLAFGLRDETKHLSYGGQFFAARELICCKVSGWYEREQKEEGRTHSSLHDAGVWFTREAQPIHWVIASLIAKQLAKEKK